MSQEALKKQAAEAAMAHLGNCSIIGVGTGSTVNHFIDCLADIRNEIEGTVSSSDASTERLKKLGIPVLELSQTGDLDIYVDGADEINNDLQMIKGGGGALTREKIIAAASKKFICIADASKKVDILGQFPLPIEVIPMARSFVARQILKLGGQPVWRENCVTDNGNQIIDIHNFEIMEPIHTERLINNIPGVVTVGLFANRGADVALLASGSGVETLLPPT